MNKILVFNDSFFEVSQTFIFQQLEALPNRFNGVDLLSYKFKNPNNFEIELHRV